MRDSSQLGICQRIAEIRAEVAGPRGKSLFAKKLGISPSTYDYYEARRVPPADVLVRIADVAGVDLRWLLTGEAGAGPAVPAGHPVLRRAASLLAQWPDSAAPLGAFIDILVESLKFPAKGDAGRAGAPHTGDAPSPVSPPAAPRPVPGATLPPPPATEDPQPPEGGIAAGGASWIPILGRSAAGVPQFWSHDHEAAGIRTLQELATRPWRPGPARSQPACVTGLDLRPESQARRGPLRDLPVQIVTLDGPDGNDVAEYVSSPEVKARYGDAFAVRIDGESMSPEIRHGDIVVLSPSAPATEGRPAVVQLQRQIGVTCKLYRREGDSIHLVPVNDQFAPQSFPADNVVWALRVLATIRPAKPGAVIA
jgi:transcriptional regulator with XRE-family HTH domain